MKSIKNYPINTMIYCPTRKVWEFIRTLVHHTGSEEAYDDYSDICIRVDGRGWHGKDYFESNGDTIIYPQEITEFMKEALINPSLAYTGMKCSLPLTEGREEYIQGELIVTKSQTIYFVHNDPNYRHGATPAPTEMRGYKYGWSLANDQSTTYIDGTITYPDKGSDESSSFPILEEGDLVERGPDWNWGTQDEVLGERVYGVVKLIEDSTEFNIRVLWMGRLSTFSYTYSENRQDIIKVTKPDWKYIITTKEGLNSTMIDPYVITKITDIGYKSSTGKIRMRVEDVKNGGTWCMHYPLDNMKIFRTRNGAEAWLSKNKPVDLRETKEAVNKEEETPAIEHLGYVPLKVGDRVVRGKDWIFSDQDKDLNNRTVEGTVIEILYDTPFNPKESAIRLNIRVEWDTGRKNNYGYGLEVKHIERVTPLVYEAVHIRKDKAKKKSVLVVKDDHVEIFNKKNKERKSRLIN